MSFIDHLNKWLTALQALAVVGGVVVALYQLNEIAAQTAIQSRTLEDQKIDLARQVARRSPASGDTTSEIQELFGPVRGLWMQRADSLSANLR